MSGFFSGLNLGLVARELDVHRFWEKRSAERQLLGSGRRRQGRRRGRAEDEGCRRGATKHRLDVQLDVALEERLLRLDVGGGDRAHRGVGSHCVRCLRTSLRVESLLRGARRAIDAIAKSGRAWATSRYYSCAVSHELLLFDVFDVSEVLFQTEIPARRHVPPVWQASKKREEPQDTP